MHMRDDHLPARQQLHTVRKQTPRKLISALECRCADEQCTELTIVERAESNHAASRTLNQLNRNINALAEKQKLTNVCGAARGQ